MASFGALARPGLLRRGRWVGYARRIGPPSPPIRSGDVMPMHSFLTVLAASALLAAPDGREAAGPFAQRGYYITFMRMPTYDLADWKRIIDGIHDDGGNTLLLWVGGAFRSKKYPITWAYNPGASHARIIPLAP